MATLRLLPHILIRVSKLDIILQRTLYTYQFSVAIYLLVLPKYLPVFHIQLGLKLKEVLFLEENKYRAAGRQLNVDENYVRG